LRSLPLRQEEAGKGKEIIDVRLNHSLVTRGGGREEEGKEHKARQILFINANLRSAVREGKGGRRGKGGERRDARIHSSYTRNEKGGRKKSPFHRRHWEKKAGRLIGQEGRSRREELPRYWPWRQHRRGKGERKGEGGHHMLPFQSIA